MAVCTKVTRLSDLRRFYELAGRLEKAVGGTRTLDTLGKYKDWPRRGVYFFFEPGEARTDSGRGPRVVRIGTHALTAGSNSSLRQRLSQHAGNRSGGGNHRGSIFRLLIGQALMARGDIPHCRSWAVKSDLGKAGLALNLDRQTIVAEETPAERAVSEYMRAMPFIFLAIEDEAGSQSVRGLIERNSIALLSNFEGQSLDPPTETWLGQYSPRPLVSASGLWNQRHVAEAYDPAFLDVFEDLIAAMES